MDSGFHNIRNVTNFIISSLKSNLADVQGSKMILDSLFRDVSILVFWNLIDRISEKIKDLPCANCWKNTFQSWRIMPLTMDK